MRALLKMTKTANHNNCASSIPHLNGYPILNFMSEKHLSRVDEPWQREITKYFHSKVRFEVTYKYIPATSYRHPT